MSRLVHFCFLLVDLDLVLLTLGSSHGQLHDGVDYVVGVVLERLHGLGTRDIGLGHDELNVLLLHSGLVDLLIVILLLGDGRLVAGCALTAEVGGLRGLGRLELGGGVDLRLLRQILDLGLAEHDVRVGGGVLVDVRLADHKEDVLRLADRHPGDAGHLLQPQLGHDLPGLLLPPSTAWPWTRGPH